MFTVIGERINTTLKKVKAPVTDCDGYYIRDDVRKQTEAGATYIDVDAGARIGHEEQDLKWLLEVVQGPPICRCASIVRTHPSLRWLTDWWKKDRWSILLVLSKPPDRGRSDLESNMPQMNHHLKIRQKTAYLSAAAPIHGYDNQQAWCSV